MPLDPREAHALEQLQARLMEVGRVCAAYARHLEAEGYPEHEAYASARALEGRFEDMLLADWRQPTEARAWSKVLDEIEREVRRRSS